MRLSLKLQQVLAEVDEVSLLDWQIAHRLEFDLDNAGFADDARIPMHLGEIEDELLPEDCLYGKQSAMHRQVYSLDEARRLGIRWDDSNPDEARLDRGGPRRFR